MLTPKSHRSPLRDHFRFQPTLRRFGRGNVHVCNCVNINESQDHFKKPIGHRQVSTLAHKSTWRLATCGNCDVDHYENHWNRMLTAEWHFTGLTLISTPSWPLFDCRNVDFGRCENLGSRMFTSKSHRPPLRVHFGAPSEKAICRSRKW